MTINLNEIPSLSGPPRLFGVHSGRPRPTRREFLGGVLTLGAAIALGTFQRPAAAHTATSTDYNIGPDCGGVTSYEDCGGCNTSRVIGGCCSSTDSEIVCPKGAGYHKHSHSTYDLRPNVCPPTSGYDYSGWYWKWTGCCVLDAGVCRKDRTWRCHDGYINGKASICNWVTSGGTSCTPCPQ